MPMLRKKPCCPPIHPPPAVPAGPFCPRAWTGLAAVHFETTCLSFGPALLACRKIAGFPTASAGDLWWLGAPSLSKSWGEEVRAPLELPLFRELASGAPVWGHWESLGRSFAL